MIYAGELLISSLIGSSTYFIPLNVLHLSLAFLLFDVKMLMACQLLYWRGEGDFVLKQEDYGKISILYFFNTEVSLQQLAQILRQSFKLIIVSAVA